jgi:two-component system OmpR family sensor kinase
VIRGSSLRWRLVAWVSAVLLAVCAVTFVVVYQETGSRLRAQVDADVDGDLTQLTQTARSFPTGSSALLARRLRSYIGAQPFSGTSSLLLAVIPGHGTVSNHAELFGAGRPDDGESVAQQDEENAEGRALLSEPVGLRSAVAPDVGPIRLKERLVRIDGAQVRLGAGESLLSVTRAQRGVARSFLIAGALALILVLIASYVAGVAVSRPLRRLSRIAQQVDDGDLKPRMRVSSSAGSEIRVLADSFNHMLDRLASAFAQQRDFVADASHELRTPLTVIAGQLEVLAAQDDPPREEVQRVARIVNAEVARTSRLVDDLLLLTRSEQADFLRPEPIELPEYVEELWSATIAGHERRFTLSPVPRVALVADPDRLAQALRNLITNAIAHTASPDGHVGLETEVAAGDVRFTVVDDGPGIPVAERERVFERFHRTDTARNRAAGGAGLGLAIVEAIAVAHGGSAHAREPLGSSTGARVTLTLPGLRPAAHRRARRPAVPSS